MNDQDWHAWRAGNDLPDDQQPAVGASTVARCATGRYGGIHAAVAERLGLVTNDIDPYLAQRGLDWEQAVATMTHLATGLYVVGEQTWAQHPEHPWARATVDGFLSAVDPADIDDLAAVLEIKTRSAGATGFPWDYVEAQVQWQMFVTGLDLAVIVVAYIDDVTGKLVGLKVRELHADYAYQNELVGIADDYRLHCQMGEVPVRDDADLDTVKRVQVVNEPGPVELTPGQIVVEREVSKWFERFHEAKTMVKLYDDQRKTAEAVIRQLIQGTKSGRCGEWVATLNARRYLSAEGEQAILDAHPELGKTVLDRDRAKAEQPELYDNTRTITYTLNVKEQTK